MVLHHYCMHKILPLCLKHYCISDSLCLESHVFNHTVNFVEFNPLNSAHALGAFLRTTIFTFGHDCEVELSGISLSSKGVSFRF